jgi:hypothetical protein
MTGGDRRAEIFHFHPQGFLFSRKAAQRIWHDVRHYTVLGSLTLVLVRSLNAMELAHEGNEGARFVSRITLAQKLRPHGASIPTWDDYTSGPDNNLAPRATDVLKRSFPSS